MGMEGERREGFFDVPGPSEAMDAPGPAGLKTLQRTHLQVRDEGCFGESHLWEFFAAGAQALAGGRTN